MGFFDFLFKCKKNQDKIVADLQSKNDILNIQLGQCQDGNKKLINAEQKLISERETFGDKMTELNNQKSLEIQGLKDSINALQNINADTALEAHCKDVYALIDNLNYENKSNIQGKPIALELNELITPNSFEVMRWKKRLTLTGDLFDRTQRIGNKAARDFTWTDDGILSKSGDYYLFPREMIAYKKGDCEDHAFVVASCDKEIGVAYGFLNGDIAHAWNVIFYEGRLWHVDTIGDRVEIQPIDRTDSDFEIYFIITQKYTFRVKSGVAFGTIASWD